ncbi:hypothetical protein GCM10022393_32730 [Aquimarina addita]|uniref:DUF3857 domain-containing protein n=2 Tax=Aquimarina addita TaxID=870485 RepID=A0ABP6UPX2_9FLAO
MVVSKADLANTTYKNDSTAGALHIFEKGYSRIENGKNYNLLTDYKRKIKILDKEGYTKTKIEILLYKDKNNKEKLNNLIAHTFNLENGEIVSTKVKENDIYEEEYNENYTLVKFTFPNIKPGSVIRYSYQLESPFVFNFNGWDFQDDIPKLYSEYITDLPGNYTYNIKLIGPLTLSTNESSIIKNCLEGGRGGSASCSHNIYAMKEIPAFREEQYMTAKKNYFSRVQYELKEFKGFDGSNKKYTETWKSVDRKIKENPNIGIQLKKAGITKAILPDSITMAPNTLEKAKSIYYYINTTYAWNKKFTIFNDLSIKKVIETKTGNVSGINILLHNTLQQQGYEVHPVLLSTRKNGYLTKLHPVISDFNYLIVQLRLGEKTYLLDATEKMLPFGDVPYRCLNQQGRLMDFKNGSSWIDIKPTMRSFYYYKENLKLTITDSIFGDQEFVYGGYHGLAKRNYINESSEASYIKNIKEQDEEIKRTNITIKNKNQLEKPFIEKRTIHYPLNQTEGLIFINPFTKPFFDENPFKLNERTYPIDFGYSDSYTYTINLEIPSGYEFIDIPKSVKYSLPNESGSLKLHFNRTNNQLSINHIIHFRSPYYSTEYYTYLKKFFNLIIDLENNTIITVKKGT